MPFTVTSQNPLTVGSGVTVEVSVPRGAPVGQIKVVVVVDAGAELTSGEGAADTVLGTTGLYAGNGDFDEDGGTCRCGLVLGLDAHCVVAMPMSAEPVTTTMAKTISRTTQSPADFFAAMLREPAKLYSQGNTPVGPI